jgi:hypothetical protein
MGAIMTITRSYIDQLLNPDPTRPRIIGKSPYTLGYEAAAASLNGQGCSLRWTPRWGDSFWTCPVNQLWRLTLDEDTDTVSLRRLWRGW